MTVSDLREQWLPYKAEHSNRPTAIRLHRAFSWLQRAEQAQADKDPDIAMVTLWIALNSLYGKWDQARNESEPDKEGWRSFLTQMLVIDTQHTISTVLIEHKKLVMAILDDSYLHKHFWREPSTAQALKTTHDKHRASTWYLEKNWAMVLDSLMNHIYLLRCQLMHGAATHQSKLNRSSLRQCTIMLQYLLEAILTVWIQNGRDEDWGTMCYPPVK